MITLGDGIDGLQGCRNVGLILTDMPSGETSAAFDKKLTVADMARFWVCAWQALRPSGVVVLMASSIRFAAHVIDSQPRSFRYDIVWSKSFATGFLYAKQRPLRAHEFVLVFSAKGQSTYHPQRTTGHVPIARNGVSSPAASKSSENYGHQAFTISRVGATDRFPRSVLKFGSVGNRSAIRVHPQQKPDALLGNLIATYSDPGDLVVDPFAGSGSTGRAAIAVGRRFLGWDSDPRFGT